MHLADPAVVEALESMDAENRAHFSDLIKDMKEAIGQPSAERLNQRSSHRIGWWEQCFVSDFQAQLWNVLLSYLLTHLLYSLIRSKTILFYSESVQR